MVETCGVFAFADGAGPTAARAVSMSKVSELCRGQPSGNGGRYPYCGFLLPSFRGRPGFHGRTVRPRRRSTCSRKLGLPNGRPVCVARRNPATAVVSSSTPAGPLEQLRCPPHQLRLPLPDLRGVEFVPRGQLTGRLHLPECFQRHLRLQLPAMLLVRLAHIFGLPCGCHQPPSVA